ncbi:MAG: hypothetical protein QMD77_01365 [Patescibacteria group bacterium]|nr:hypothetical protein [Patescibacteria group bacterium]
MSHKTLYINVDEEITSIIDRVRKSAASEIIIVAPKQTMLLQSLVNLKLLKKETDRRGKKIIIVTQDKNGKKLIEQAGILVQKKFDDSEHDDREEYIAEEKKIPRQNENILDDIENEDKEPEIGSDRYFDEPLPKKEEKGAPDNIGQISFIEKKTPERGQKKSSQKQGLGKKLESKEKNEGRVRMSDIIAGPKQKTKKSKKFPSKKTENEKRPMPQTDGFYKGAAFGAKADKKTDVFFSENPANTAGKYRREEKIMKTERVRGKISRYFLFFSVVFLTLAIFAGAYFFLPRATIVAYLKNQEKAVSSNLEASLGAGGVDSEKNVIPAALEQIVAEKKEEFSASGSKSGGGKAVGSIVVYNEFSAENQPLVATTRFETEDGKIFRITKNIIVPGMTKVGSETKPGAIEAGVVADKPGEEYNIDASTFKIPGFKGGPKYEKFYAKSPKAMSGGAKGDSMAITAQDIAEAKDKLLAEAQKEAVSQLEKGLPADRRYFSDTIKTEIVSAVPSANAGTQTEKFFYTIKVKAKTLSFSEEDVKSAIKNQMEKEGVKAEFINFEKPLNFLLIESAKDGNSLKFEVKTDAKTASGIDVENFKKGSLGKNSAELESFIKNYPSIQKADVNFWPFFVTRVPMNEKRVKIEIKQAS